LFYFILNSKNLTSSPSTQEPELPILGLMARQRTKQHWIEPDNKYHRAFHNFKKNWNGCLDVVKSQGFRLLPYTFVENPLNSLLLSGELLQNCKPKKIKEDGFLKFWSSLITPPKKK
jgi:hypothetical protein